MYLIHITETKYLESILKDGELKSNKLTNNISSGDSIYYNLNKFIYFSTTDKLFDKKVYGDIILYFTSDLLYNRKFYVSTMWSDAPNYLDESKGEYKRKYPRYYKEYDQVLSKLYKKSINKLPNGKSFQVFQQVAIENKVNIKDKLIGIKFKIKPTDKIIKYINIHYPMCKIIF